MVGSVGALCTALLIAAHPLHTSFAQVKIDSRAGVIDVSLRVFIDDFTAGARAQEKSNADYARSTLLIRDAKGAAIPFASCGEKRSGDLMWICLRAHAASRPATVFSQVLFERFDDQVNVVQAIYDSRKSNLLFANGDREKRLP